MSIASISSAVVHDIKQFLFDPSCAANLKKITKIALEIILAGILAGSAAYLISNIILSHKIKIIVSPKVMFLTVALITKATMVMIKLYLHYKKKSEDESNKVPDRPPTVYRRLVNKLKSKTNQVHGSSASNDLKKNSLDKKS